MIVKVMLDVVEPMMVAALGNGNEAVVVIDTVDDHVRLGLQAAFEQRSLAWVEVR